jgi:hypothetical protein
MKKAKIFITRQGYDPQLGKHVKDPYLGDVPSIGACRPDFRRVLKVGDELFVISGRVAGADQFVMGGFEVAERMTVQEAYRRYPNQRLRQLPDGQLTGNIITNSEGQQHALDDHEGFERRIQNYTVGRNPIALRTEEEISRGRSETMEALQDIFKKKGKKPIDIISRFGRTMSETQSRQLRHWLESIKEISH